MISRKVYFTRTSPCGDSCSNCTTNILIDHVAFLTLHVKLENCLLQNYFKYFK